ncbi:MAG: glutamine-hydrolyzing carbamoyl-phosphate synthase small subunit [DPANN group archaeon]|nr:glutamine-hydrolyzing carbamoyl-phosphate synthase small subunit [DPANN group archaeon]
MVRATLKRFSVSLFVGCELAFENGKKAELALESGAVFIGEGFGADASVSGEVVFNTGMAGYPQSLTDPSYKGQILVLTYPLIGNYGVSESPLESERIQISGLVVSEHCEKYSHWSAKFSLGQWLKASGVPAISGVDTRALTKELREHGTMLGKLAVDGADVKFSDPNKRNLVAEVSAKQPLLYESSFEKPVLIDRLSAKTYHRSKKLTAVLVDCGAKNSIVRSLLARNVRVIKVPWDYDFFSLKFDFAVLSNGPGDPKLCAETIKNVRRLLDEQVPTLGVCLGNQILALAAGGNTYKMKYGHRSQNQPCTLASTKRCIITSQNHGFAVDAGSLPSEWLEWFNNENDNTNEGIIHESGIFRAVQFHPEAAPGPRDANYIFDEFLSFINLRGK